MGDEMVSVYCINAILSYSVSLQTFCENINLGNQVFLRMKDELYLYKEYGDYISTETNFHLDI